ncbi:MAG: FAD-dependent oxidoreductase, partial [Candidatus Binataceae bacterium]
MDKKLGVYICSGCSIGESVNVDALVGVAQKEYKVPVCRTHPFLCGAEGVAMIRQDLANNEVNAVAIAACSPRVKTDAFSFDPCMVFERVNLREHVVWSHKAGDEETQALAEDYLRIGLAKAGKMQPLEPLADEISKAILVLGGGVTGITAALEAAAAYYDVVLVEKSEHLGGHLAEVKRLLPTRPPYTGPATSDLPQQIQKVTSHPRVKVFTSTTIVRIEGQPGMFDVTLQTGAESSVHRVGAIVMATGWKPYDATKLGHLGYGLSRNVVTNVEFEKMAVAGRWTRPSDGGPLKRVVFIQCAGSRDPAHLPYCSATCCMETLKQAQYLHEESPQSEVYVVYKDIITPGQYEKFYQTVQDHPTTFFTKGEVEAVEVDPVGAVRVSLRHTLLGEALQITADLVVLATGMVPNSADSVSLQLLRDAKAKLARGEANGQRAEAEKTVERLKHLDGTEILNLAYRQGPDLPLLRNGFPTSNFVCFPYETMRTAIYAAGAVREPMDAAFARDDA